MKFKFHLLLAFLPVVTICFSDFVPEKHPAWNLLDQRSCGISMRDRIIGGREAKLGEYPWLVQVGTQGRTLFGKIELFYCGGAIISPKYVISAAHCIPLQNVKTLNAVRAGDHDLKKNVDCDEDGCAPAAQIKRIANIYIHPKYDNPPAQNDIIVVKMEIPFEFNDFVRHICLLPSALLNENFNGMNGQVAGWGIYDIERNAQSSVLNVVTLRVMGNEECVPVFKNYINITSTQMCVGGVVGKDSCSGDSGGPLMKMFAINGPPRYYLIGVVSLGFTRCGATSSPGIYTRVNKYEDWVLDTIQDADQE